MKTQGKETAVPVFGVSTQVPTREIFLTSEPPRMPRLGNRTVELKHGNRWQHAIGKRPAELRAPSAKPMPMAESWVTLSRRDWTEALEYAAATAASGTSACWKMYVLG